MTTGEQKSLDAAGAAGERILVRDRLANQATITLRDLAGHVVREVSVTTTVNNVPRENPTAPMPAGESMLQIGR